MASTRLRTLAYLSAFRLFEFIFSFCPMPLSTCVYKFNHFFIFFCSEMNRNSVPETGKSHDREHREIRMHGPKIEYAFGVRCSRVNSFSHIFALNLTYDIIINSPGSDLELCATVQYARFLSTTRIHFTWNANSDTHTLYDRSVSSKVPHFRFGDENHMLPPNALSNVCDGQPIELTMYP